MRERIIETASNMFMKYGVKSVTMDDIAAELSISKKTLYQFFKDKSEIVMLVMQFHVCQDQEEFKRIQEEAGNTLEEFLMLTAKIKEMMRNMNPIILYELKKYYPEAWKTFNGYKNEFMRSMVISSLQKGIAEGIFRAEINPEVLAVMRINQIELAFDPELYPPRDFNILEVQLQFFEHFIYGVCNRKGFELMEEHKARQVKN